jgi:uncharacterized protein
VSIISKVIGLALVATGLVLISAVSIARYAVLGQRRPLRVISTFPEGTIRLPWIGATEQPSTFGLESRGSLYQVHDVVGRTRSHIDRRVAGRAPKPGERVRLVGNIFGSRSDLVRDAVLRGDNCNGLRVAHWDILPAAEPGTRVWFIHVHGLGAAPSSTLRSVDSVRGAGYPSTVVSLDAHRDINHRSRGISSAHLPRVMAAIDHALRCGAEKVVLVGWSYGARLSIDAASRRPEVAGAVLISPMLDFREAFWAGAKRSKLPGPVIRAAESILSTPVLCRLAGVDKPLRQLLPANGSLPARTPPLLLIHSRGDNTVNFDQTVQFRAQGRFSADLVEFPPSPHTLEWNSDPDRFARSLQEWTEANVVRRS